MKMTICQTRPMPVPSCRRRIRRARVSGRGGRGGFASPVASSTSTSAGPPARAKAIFHSGAWSVGQVTVDERAGRVRPGGGERRVGGHRGSRQRPGAHRARPVGGGPLLALGWLASNAPNTLGKEIQKPVKLSIASGSRIQKPIWWWRLALVEFCRFQRKPRLTLPVDRPPQPDAGEAGDEHEDADPADDRPAPARHHQAAVEDVEDPDQAGIARRAVEHAAVGGIEPDIGPRRPGRAGLRRARRR